MRVESLLHRLSPGKDFEGYATDIGKLLTSSGIYALAALALPLVTLVLLPFLTHTLSRSDYGVLAVLTTAISLLAGITQFGLNNAFFRAYNYDYETSEDKLAVLSTVIILLALSSFPLACVVELLAPWLATLLLGSSSYSNLVRLLPLVIVLQNFTVPGFSWLRAESRAAAFAVCSIANLLVNLVATVLFVGAFHLGVSGALLAMASGYGFVVICTLPLALLRAKLRFRRDISWNLLSFGLPLVSNLVSIWVLQLADRYLLSRLGSLAETASYTVAYSLGGILGVVVLSPFSLAWPTTMFKIAKRADAVPVFRLIFRWYGAFLLFATFGLMLVSISALYLLFPAPYYVAMPVIPVVALSIMFFGMYSYFTVGILIRRKNWLEFCLTGMAAIVNVGLNLILIPHYGAMGAAFSTLLAYFLLAVGGYIVNQRLYPVPFEVGLFGLMLLIGIGLYGGGAWFVQAQSIGGIEALAIFGGLFCLYVGLLVYLSRRPQLFGNRAWRKNTMRTKSNATLPAKVCLHVLREGRTDVRAMRSATTLARAGFEVSIVDVEAQSAMAARENIGDVRMEHLIIPNWYTARRFELWFFLVAIRTFFLSVVRLIQTRADVYHANELTALPACFIAATLRRKPLIFEIYDLQFPVPETHFTFWRRTGALLYSLLLPRCAGVIATSPFHIQELRKRYHVSDMTLVRNVPVYQAVAKSDRLRQFLGLGPGVRIALYQGNIQPDRGLDKLVHAATFLEQDTVIVMMGKGFGTVLARLEALIEQEGVADRVKIIPPIPYEELFAWTASADIGLILHSPGYSLNVRTLLPNKLFEYLMAGLPVLSSQMDAVSEVIEAEHVGSIVSSSAPADIGAAINALLAEPEALAQMRKNALDVAQQKFNWEREQVELIRLYTKILGIENGLFEKEQQESQSEVVVTS